MKSRREIFNPDVELNVNNTFSNFRKMTNVNDVSTKQAIASSMDRADKKRSESMKPKKVTKNLFEMDRPAGLYDYPRVSNFRKQTDVKAASTLHAIAELGRRDVAKQEMIEKYLDQGNVPAAEHLLGRELNEQELETGKIKHHKKEYFPKKEQYIQPKPKPAVPQAPLMKYGETKLEREIKAKHKLKHVPRNIIPVDLLNGNNGNDLDLMFSNIPSNSSSIPFWAVPPHAPKPPANYGETKLEKEIKAKRKLKPVKREVLPLELLDKHYINDLDFMTPKPNPYKPHKPNQPLKPEHIIGRPERIYYPQSAFPQHDFGSKFADEKAARYYKAPRRNFAEEKAAEYYKAPSGKPSKEPIRMRNLLELDYEDESLPELEEDFPDVEQEAEQEAEGEILISAPRLPPKVQDELNAIGTDKKLNFQQQKSRAIDLIQKSLQPEQISELNRILREKKIVSKG